MLTLMTRARIAQKKRDKELTNRMLAEILGVKYGTLTMVLCGRYENKKIEQALKEWLDNA